MDESAFIVLTAYRLLVEGPVSLAVATKVKVRSSLGGFVIIRRTKLILRR
jgi:hypothetical protein